MISLSDPGFRWGYGLFETLVVQEGQVQFSDWHWQSLCDAADVLGLDLPDQRPTIGEHFKNGIWRWFLTPTGLYDFYEEGIASVPESYSLSISPLQVDSRSWEARFKTLSYLQRYQAREEAKTEEVIMLNERGEVASASMANLFVIDHDMIKTPPLDSGCRAGVIRRWIMEQTIVPVQEVVLDPAEIRKASACFVSNSRIGICSAFFEGEEQSTTHPIILQLKQALSDEIRG